MQDETMFTFIQKQQNKPIQNQIRDTKLVSEFAELVKMKKFASLLKTSNYYLARFESIPLLIYLQMKS
jgi:hypothetical protein